MKNALLGFFLLAGVAVLGQAPAARLDNGLVQFFSGSWKGAGAFANGKKIAASVSFHLALDSTWLVCEHRDNPPNSYAADLYWGVDAATGKFVAYAFDNFHGHREFVSAGWVDGKLELKRPTEAPGAGKYYERFVYQRATEASFRMRYEVSRDGEKWQLGDSLVFTRK
jgi:hypothetical protein